MSRHTGRSTRRFKAITRQLRAQHRPCWICRQPIDYTLLWPHPRAFTADHKLAKHTHPHLAEDPANIDAAHFQCNNSKGSRVADAPLGHTAQQW